jgi:tetratricopeptide (TPR) repeat protein
MLYKALIYIFTRSLVIFIFVYAVVSLFINYQRIEVADKSKMSFYSHPSAYAELVDGFESGKKIDHEKFSEYNYFLIHYLKTHPEAYDAMYVLAFLNANQNDFKQAEDLYKEIQENKPQNIWVLYNLGVISLKNNKLDEANQIFKKIISTGPEEAMAFFKDSDTILAPIMHQAKLMPNDLRRRIKEIYRQSYQGLVISYEKLENFKEMGLAAQMALVANVGYKGDFLFYAGKAKYYEKNYLEAEKLLKDAIGLRKDHLEAYKYLIAVLKHENKSIELKEFQTKLTELSSMNIPTSLENKIEFRLF